MDYELLKEQWADVEDKDGVRLSWNVFPSSRMVAIIQHKVNSSLNHTTGSLEARSPYRRPLHTTQSNTRNASTSV